MMGELGKIGQRNDSKAVKAEQRNDRSIGSNDRPVLLVSLQTALPVMAGYVAIGMVAGIMQQQIGMNVWQVFLFSLIFYSGAGQFMLPNLWLAGTPLASAIASIGFVNSRQVLYSAALSQYCRSSKKWQSFLFAATVTDETFGVNVSRFKKGGYPVSQAVWVNLFSVFSWVISNIIGVVIGEAMSIPQVIASFAMTSIFICLLATQKFDRVTLIVSGVSALTVCILKAIGLSGPAILLGAICGVIVGLLVDKGRRNLEVSCGVERESRG